MNGKEGRVNSSLDDESCEAGRWIVFLSKPPRFEATRR